MRCLSLDFHFSAARSWRDLTVARTRTGLESVRTCRIRAFDRMGAVSTCGRFGFRGIPTRLGTPRSTPSAVRSNERAIARTTENPIQAETVASPSRADCRFGPSSPLKLKNSISLVDPVLPLSARPPTQHWPSRTKQIGANSVYIDKPAKPVEHAIQAKISFTRTRQFTYFTWVCIFVRA